VAAAMAGAAAAMPFFGQRESVQWKVDESTVGEADHAADAAIQARSAPRS
jgi:fructose-1,6-bisphosphatase/inositol monophosphatase family enzyme